MTLKWFWRAEDKFLARAEEAPPRCVRIPNPPGPDFVYDGTAWVRDPEYYKSQRVAEYPPIGDQLDAILKTLNYMQMNLETDLVKDMDDIIQKWLTVKQKYPKPEGTP